MVRIWLELHNSTLDHYHEECGIYQFRFYLEVGINKLHDQLLEWAIENGHCTNVV